MKENENSIVSIFAAKRSWYELVLAAVFFSITIYLVLTVIFVTYLDHSLLLFVNNMRIIAGAGVLCFISGLRFSVVRHLQIDIKQHLIITTYVVGPFSREVKSKVTEFEYVSFFEDKYGSFGTNLWYVRNRHFKMYEFENKEAAYKFALDISNKLNIDLLDATVKGNFKWIEKENLK